MRGPLHARARRRLAAVGAWLLLGPAAWCGAALGADDAVANAVKAAFLQKFALFVEWPASTFASPTSPLHLCIVGDDPFGAALKKAGAEARVGEREIEVVRLKAVARETACQIVYIAPSESARVATILETLRGSNVLTVGDGRATGGGAPIIQFFVDQGRVRFIIDDDAASANNLDISSKLLTLAASVRARKDKE